MKTRIISALVAIVLLAGVLYFHSTIVFNAAFSLIGCLMVYELFHAYKQEKSWVFIGVSLLFPAYSAITPRLFVLSSGIYSFILVGFAYICVCTAIIIIDSGKSRQFDLGRGFVLMLYTVLISVSVFSIAYIEVMDIRLGLYNVICSLCAAWLADSGAYFAGTFFGRHKLCPTISPKKTVEGLIGGILSNALIMILAGFIISKIDSGLAPNYIILAAAGVLGAVLGLIGDLLASLVKRQCGIKDYGNIMPGHGGALDRFDSVVFVAPAMALMLTRLSFFLAL